MDLQQILSLIGALGIGSFVGILIQSFLTRKLSDKKMLFDARIKAYSGITGRLFNFFLEPDITSLPDDALIFAKLNQLLSETMLMAGHDLAELVGSHKVKCFEFHVAMGKKDDKLAGILHKELTVLVGKIHDQMRKDLHVDDSSVFLKTVHDSLT